ncbi:hypothetical protein MTO96_002564 [Rhipicephalus appendiculatus]
MAARLLQRPLGLCTSAVSYHRRLTSVSDFMTCVVFSPRTVRLRGELGKISSNGPRFVQDTYRQKIDVVAGHCRQEAEIAP